MQAAPTSLRNQSNAFAECRCPGRLGSGSVAPEQSASGSCRAPSAQWASETVEMAEMAAPGTQLCGARRGPHSQHASAKYGRLRSKLTFALKKLHL